MSGFADSILGWHARYGRHDLPWQHPRSAYRVWVAEVMLQQTRVSTVLKYFDRFLCALPTLPVLARASEDQVMALWSGLGYYRRARFLHHAAQICMHRHDGQLPRDFAALQALPGIGRSTAGAILAQAHGQRYAILDGNAKRLLARFHGVRGWTGTALVESRLWGLAERNTPDARIADYTQAIMDLGATVCSRVQPRCDACPLHANCVARRYSLTAELPQARPRKELPERTTCMLILHDVDDRVLLLRRGPSGVWPSLWSLPEAVDRSAAQRTIAGICTRPGSPLTWPEFTHAFTHYRLRIQPLSWSELSPRRAIADNGDQQWCGRAEWPQLGLPAPVRRLLESLPEAN